MTIDQRILENPQAYVGKEIAVGAGGQYKRVLVCIYDGIAVCECDPKCQPKERTFIGWTHARPLEPRRVVPTDEDAKRRPKCWYRDHDEQAWMEGVLIHVITNGTRYPFMVLREDGCRVAYQACEIEAPNE